uniref:Uncharacterized protein n=1 Tax=Arundo donax TaxID=35708 RepID=A0A0A8Z1U1_ARUDO
MKKLEKREHINRIYIYCTYCLVKNFCMRNILIKKP